jgi:ribokinase
MSGADHPGTGRVIVVGSVNVDTVMRLPRLPVPGETVLDGDSSRHHGGKGANQAVAASRAGAAVHLVGAVGADDGADSLDSLRAEGVDVSGVAAAPVPTGLAVVLVASGSGENLIAVASGANATVTAGHVRDRLAAIDPGPADVIVLSFELPAEPLRAAAILAARSGARLVINPAPARPGYEGLLRGAIVTPNAHELAGLTAAHSPEVPRAQDAPGTAAVALADRVEAAVIVTLGADGALLAVAGTTEHYPGHRVTALDTTGAGDTLTGVLAASLALGHDLRTSLRRAVAAAALAVTQPGARSAMPSAAAIDELLSRG